MDVLPRIQELARWSTTQQPCAATDNGRMNADARDDRRKTRRKRLALVALLFAVGFVIVACRHVTRPPRYFGFIDGFVAVDAHSAVIVWRTNDEGPPRSWVSRVDDQGDPQWVQPIPALALSNGGAGPVTVTDGVAVVRYAHRGGLHAGLDNAAIAFDLADGHVLWDRILSQYSPREYEPGHWTELDTLPLYISDLAVGKNLVSFADAGDAHREVATSSGARSGAVNWTHAVPRGRFAPIVFGESYATHYVQSTLITDARTGAEREHRVAGPGCVVGGDYVVVEDAGDAKRLVAYASATAEPRVIASEFSAFAGHATVHACGRYLERFVFLVESDFPTHRFEAVVTGPDGALLHRILLSEGVGIVGDALQQDPIHATFGGDLPRFVLYPTADDDESQSLVMVDLEAGTIAWRGKQDPTLLSGSLFHRGTRWIWVDSGGGAAPTIAVFDGVTGKLQGAIDAYSYNGVLNLGRATTRIATLDTLWLYAGDFATPSDAAIANIDLATMKPRFVRTIRLTDSTAAVRQRLGI